MNLDELLGIDLGNPSHRLARLLADEDAGLVDALVMLRKRSGKSQSDVAAAMGVSQSAVARIESGDRDPHLSTLRRYAHAVGAQVTHTAVPYVHVQTTDEGLAPLPVEVRRQMLEIRTRARAQTSRG